VVRIDPTKIARFESAKQGRQRRPAAARIAAMLLSPDDAHVDKSPRDIDRVFRNRCRAGYEIAGIFVWFQALDDMVDQASIPPQPARGYDRYSLMMAHFIRDVRVTWDSPELPLSIASVRRGGPVDGLRTVATTLTYRTHQGSETPMPHP